MMFTASPPRAVSLYFTFMQSLVHGSYFLKEGRNFVGVELFDHYASIAEERLRGALAQDDFELAGPEK